MTVAALTCLWARELLVNDEVRPREIQFAVWASTKISANHLMLVQDIDRNFLLAVATAMSAAFAAMFGRFAPRYPFLADRAIVIS